MKTMTLLTLVAVLCFTAVGAQQAAYGIPQDYQMSRAHGGSMIIHLKTWLFNGHLYEDWDHSCCYDIVFRATFVAPDEPPDALCTRQQQETTFHIDPFCEKFVRKHKARKWKELEPGKWLVIVMVKDGKTGAILNGKLYATVTVRWDKVVELKFGSPNGNGPGNDPDLYLKSLKLKNVAYRDEPN